MDLGRIASGVFGGVAKALTGNPLGAAGDVLSSFSGGDNKSKETQNASSSSGQQTQGTQNAGKPDPNAVEVSIKADNTIKAMGTDPGKTAKVAVETKKAMDQQRQGMEQAIASNPDSSNIAQGFNTSGQTIQLPPNSTISVTT